MSPPALTYDALVLLWRVIIGIFFREIRPRGTFNIPKDGPVIFVAAPHHNQFLDPVLLSSEVFREARRQVSFLAAAKSMKRKFIGTMSELMGSIPVVRSADLAKKGTGRVRLSPNDPCVVIGTGTKFTSELAPRTSILLPKSIGSLVAEVLEVLSDTEVRVKKEFGGEKGTAKIHAKVDEAKEVGQEGLPFDVLPHVDQGSMYENVYSRLKAGGCIGIFPEGGSHDRTDLLPLKVGVSLMALGAMANNPDLKVKIVPVGLSYFHAHRFRSRAVVEFGSPLDVPEEFVEMFRKGGDSKRDATGKLLDLIYDALKTVTVRSPDYETLMLIQAGRRLYKTPGQHLTLGQVVELNRRLLEGYQHFQHEPRVQKLKEDVLKYNRSIRDLGLKDHQVPRATRAGWKSLGLLTYRFGLLTAWTVLALPGVVLNGPIFLAASIISRKKAKEALAASTVKVAGRDVLATWKVLVALGVTPFLYSFYAAVATIVAVKAGAPLKWRIWTPFLVMLALPCIGFSALKFGEAGMDVLKSLRPLIVSLIPGQQKQLDKIKAERERISNELSDVINEFGPKLYEDFDEWRILVPSASAPPSGSTTKPGLWRRKSTTGGVDGQGNLLVHPMTWLDERLFGWSRSAKRGTSAWGGVSRSSEPSAHPTPEHSDDEAIGDYDNILGYLPGFSGGLSKKPRSHHASYADLQQLRRGEGTNGLTPMRSRSNVNLDQLAPVYHRTALERSVPSSPVSPGLHLRTTPRERRNSLTDQVPVDRIGELSPVESFKEGTEELNRENSFVRLTRSGNIEKEE